MKSARDYQEMTDWIASNVLVLNASYEAIHVCGAKRALKMLVKGVAIAEEASHSIVRSEKWVVHLPHVIRLRRYVPIPHRPVKFSRRNVLLRDQHTCQYCANVFTASELTLDHVTPRSRGGATNWENVVAACKRCNHLKGDRSPAEARMQCLKKPKAPTVAYLIQLTRISKAAHESWKKYLFIN